jgi:competence protein ComEC
VRDSDKNYRIAAAGFSIDALREQISSHISEHVKDQKSGLLQALTLGLRADIDPQDWDTLIATGTNHLLAISGLHIGLAAGFGYWLVLRLWRLSAKLCTWFPAQRAAALLSLFPALTYAALAGFSVPTQRALIMLSVIAIAVAWSRSVAKTTVLAIALLAVLVFDSLAILSPGFWLSFTAVAVIFFGLWGNLRSSGKIRQLLWVQLWLSLALLPLTFWFFGQGSLVSPLANLLAVPFVGLLIVPLALLGIVTLYLYVPVGAALLSLANTGLDGLLTVLSYFASRDGTFIYQSISSAWILSLLLLAAGVLLLPKGLPGRWLAIFWLLPALLIKTPVPEYGGFRVSFLDVGQGLSVVVQTQKHSLVYDTGAQFSPSFGAVESVILPFLRQQGIKRIDTLILSHSDSDHAGGAVQLLDSIPIEKTLTSFALTSPHQLCRAGQRWEWEGVSFHILHPTVPVSEEDNDQSCVLSIESRQGRVLLTGDISWRSEQALITRSKTQLASTILQVPHHGSLTSSSEAFIRSVMPKYAVFNVGYRNRFGFPKPKVEQRYQQVGATLLRTDREGVVIFDFSPEHADPSLTIGRSKQYFWQNSAESGFAQ